MPITQPTQLLIIKTMAQVRAKRGNFSVVAANLLDIPADVVVCPSNKNLSGKLLATRIYEQGGPALERRRKEVAEGGAPFEPGSAIFIPSSDSGLSAKYVSNVVSIVDEGGIEHSTPESAAASVVTTLVEAYVRQLKTVAFPVLNSLSPDDENIKDIVGAMATTAMKFLVEQEYSVNEILLVALPRRFHEIKDYALDAIKKMITPMTSQN